jgi:hypothetical protein
MTRRIFGLAVLGTLSLILAGCGPTKLDKALSRLDNRPDWQQFGKIDVPRHPAEKYLEGWVIVLDPGHGGDAHLENYKRGPTGVREAEMNWRVGVLLEKLRRSPTTSSGPTAGGGRTCSSACTTTPRRASRRTSPASGTTARPTGPKSRWTPRNTSPTTWVRRCARTSRSRRRY